MHFKATWKEMRGFTFTKSYFRILNTTSWFLNMILSYPERKSSFLKFSRLIIGMIVLAVMFSSCRSYKNLILMRDADAKGVSARALPYTNYKIKTYDNLYVSVVSSNPEMNAIYNPATVGNPGSGSGNNQWSTLSGQFVFGYIVDKDGFVTLPGIGKVHVLGLTIEDSEKEITSKATQYLKDVTAKVRLLNYKVTVIGEVISPGVYYNYNPEFTVFDAISMANGTKNTTSISNVLVMREIGDQTQTYRLNLKSLSALSSEGYNLQPNDVVVVSPSRFKNLELQLPIYSLVLSSITTFILVLSFINDQR